MAFQKDLVWFITGCSTGFGNALARLVVQRGGRAVVTARDASTLSELSDLGGDRVLALPLDVTDNGQIADAVEAATGRFGRIDVLVNNAGYGYLSAIEEGEDDQIRAVFDTNVFGLFAMTRAVLPAMRAQRSGHVISITSQAGLLGLPGSGYYAATKHAIEGWSDALAAEGAPLGIKVTCVEPGPFRTDFAGRSLRTGPGRIADYAETVGRRLDGMIHNSGRQAGDPVRAGEAILAIAGDDHPPRHLVLGKVAFEGVTKTLKRRLAEIESLRDASLGADYPDA